MSSPNLFRAWPNDFEEHLDLAKKTLDFYEDKLLSWEVRSKIALNISTHTSKSSPTSITFSTSRSDSLVVVVAVVVVAVAKNRALSRRRRRRRFHLAFLFHALQPLLRIVHVIQYNLRRLFDVPINLYKPMAEAERNQPRRTPRACGTCAACCCRFKKRGLLRVFCRPLVLGVCSLFCCEVVAKVWDENGVLVHLFYALENGY